MDSHIQFGSPSFKLVAKGLLALHRLGKEGKDDSPEAESIRDALDSPLNALNRMEEERAQWLSEDLYSVSEPPAPTPLKEMTPQAQQQLNEAYEAKQNQEWDRALTLLRQWQECISPSLLSYLRGSIWLEAGNPDVAAEFFGHAVEGDPTNVNYQVHYLIALAESDPALAGERARQVLADCENFAPAVVAEAANVRFSGTKFASDADSVQVYRELIPILEKNIYRIEKDKPDAWRSPAYEMTVAKLGFCHEFLGNSVAAIDCFSRGLQANPRNDGLLVARGILMYGTSPRAVTDFEQAVELASLMVWPYFFLAHHYLVTKRFEQCRIMCERGLARPGSDSAKSQLEEWRAIAQAELGFSPELVRNSFEAAIRMDPSNDLAQRNREAFEKFFAVPHTPPRSQWDQKSAAAIRDFGLSERRYSMAA